MNSPNEGRVTPDGVSLPKGDRMIPLRDRQVFLDGHKFLNQNLSPGKDSTLFFTTTQIHTLVHIPSLPVVL